MSEPVAETFTGPCSTCAKSAPEAIFGSVTRRGQRVVRRQCAACYRARKRERERAPARPSRDVQTIAILSDVHHPEHDRDFWRAFLAWARAERPDEVILAGDFAEFASVSQHGGSLESRLTDDFATVKRALNEIADAVPGVRLVYLEGNHETRLTRTIGELAPALAGSITVPDGLDLDERGVVWVDEFHQPIRRGKLRVLHGHQFGGRFGLMHHAAKAASLFGSEADAWIVYGHTHKPQTFTRPVVGGVVTATGLGCGRTIAKDEVRWQHGAEAGWAHEFAVAYVVGDDLAQVYPVRVQKGRFVWAGKVYDGRLPDAPAR